MKKNSFLEQVRRNAVALISLFVAITGLLYNTWRNEQSEFNRNQRWAAFQLLLEIGELQELVYLYYWDPDEASESDMRRGWAKVLTIRHLCDVLEQPLPESATQLHGTWQSNWEGLRDRDPASRMAITDQIDALRTDTLEALGMLE